MTALWPWLALAGLGAFHGINPAMGWLFAVGLGLQRHSATAVMAALPPIAIGHAGAIVLAIVLVGVARLAGDDTLLRAVAGTCLVGFGLYRLARGYRHQFRTGMQVGFADLMGWSFLMATAHGAGLMVVPVLIELPAGAAMAGDHAGHTAMLETLGGSLWTGVLAVTVHTLAMLVTAGIVAWIVYAFVGLAILRRAWINLDVLWSVALIAIGVVFLVLAGMQMGAAGGAHHHSH